MPYTPAHKLKTRERIVESARHLFNRKGFAEVSIDEIMAQAGLTRGGFYNHFENKEELFVEVIEAYGRCNPSERWDGVELDFGASAAVVVEQMINAYLSREHLEDVPGHCPMIALPSDVSRASARCKDAYRQLLEAMTGLFEGGLAGEDGADTRRRALGLSALCVGGMVLGRTFDDTEFANEVREAARLTALEMATDPVSDW